MRLAFLTHEPFHPPTGGGSAEARYLVEELRRRGHGVHVFAPDGPDRRDVTRELGIAWTPFLAWRMGRYTRLRTLKYLLYPHALTRLVGAVAARVRAFDGILAQHTIAAVAAGRLKRRLRLPVIFNYLDFLTGFMESWPAWLMPRPVLRRLNRFEMTLPSRAPADGVLTVSEVLANRIAATGYPRARLCPIQYGYDARRFQFDEAAVPSRFDGPPVVVMHGSFDHHHLGPIAEEAFARVHAARPEVRFRLVGRRTPALARFLGAAARKGFSRAVEHVDFVPYDRVAMELSRCRLGIVPYEGTGGTHCAFVAKAVEYLALGLPVVSTSLEAIQLYFREEPLVRFAGFDGATFAAAILERLDEPAELTASRTREASLRVARELDWPVVTGRAVDFIERILRKATDRERGQTGT